MDSPAHTSSVSLGFQSSAIQSYIRKWAAYVTEAPKATKVFSILIVTFYLATHIQRYFAEILGLVPGYTFSSLYLWNIVTAGFYHAYFIDMVLSVITLLVVGRYLEPFWGTREFVKFVVLINASAGLGCVVWSVFGFLSSDSTTGIALLFPTVPYGGFGGVISAFAVAGRQLIPEYESPILFGLIPARVKHLPLLLLFTNAIWHFLGFPASSYSFTFVGTLTAWIYLRYYQARFDANTSLPSPDGISPKPTYGDRSDATSFIGFFPDSLHPVMNKLCFCCPLSTPLVSHHSSTFQHENKPVTITSGNVDLEAERRRLHALQQVDARIAKMKAHRTPTKSTENH